MFGLDTKEVILSHYTHRIRLTLVAGLSLALLAAGGLPANAATPAPEPAPAPQAFCWHEQVTEREACADTAQQLADTVLLTYGVRILGPATEPKAGASFVPSASAIAASGQAAGKAGKAPAGVAASYLIGALYTDAGYGGSLKVLATGQTSNPCSSPGSYTYGYGNLTLGWNDAVSSFEGYGHCGFRLFYDANYGGSVYGPYFAKSTLGPFNNQASSYEAQWTN